MTHRDPELLELSEKLYQGLREHSAAKQAYYDALDWYGSSSTETLQAYRKYMHAVDLHHAVSQNYLEYCESA